MVWSNPMNGNNFCATDTNLVMTHSQLNACRTGVVIIIILISLALV